MEHAPFASRSGLSSSSHHILEALVGFAEEEDAEAVAAVMLALGSERNCRMPFIKEEVLVHFLGDSRTRFGREVSLHKKELGSPLPCENYRTVRNQRAFSATQHDVGHKITITDKERPLNARTVGIEGQFYRYERGGQDVRFIGDMEAGEQHFGAFFPLVLVRRKDVFGSFASETVAVGATELVEGLGGDEPSVG